MVFVEYLKKSNKTAVNVDTMSPDQHAYGKYRNPVYLPDFVCGSHAGGTREIIMSRTRHGAFSTFR